MKNNSITLLKPKIDTADLLEGYWKSDLWKIDDFHLFIQAMCI